MKHLLTGLRAGALAALLLTLWSFLGATETMGQASEATGAYFVPTALGLLGMPQLVYGLVLGVVVAGWARLAGDDLGSTLSRPDHDRRAAAALLCAPVVASVVAVGVGGLHVAVTANFARTTFQALGLALGAGVLTALALVISPLVFGLFSTLTAKVFPADEAEDRAPRATLTVLGIYVIAGVSALVVAYQYASGLHVWPTSMVQMVFLALLVTPALFAMMTRFSLDRLAWTVGFPIAGAVAVSICFAGSYHWTSATAEMRRAVTQERTLVAQTAGVLRAFADRDGDGYAAGWGGVDCDDTDPTIYPGAPDVPGDGIDQSCSGADAQPPSVADHPSRRILGRAIDAARNAATKKAEQIPEPPPNVVLILVDTVRQDHLGFAGYERDTSPNIDRLADEGVAFMDAYAPSPHTPRSLPPLFFGRYPSRLNLYKEIWNYPTVVDDNLGLFEVLDDEGRYNVGMTSHFYFKPRRGMDQGFDEWDNEGALSISESNDDISAPRIWQKVEPTIETLGARWRDDEQAFGLFVHFFEPHARWIGHDEFDFGRGQTQRERHINNYDSEIAFADSYVGRVVDKLKEEGLYEDTIIIVTSDHGEAFNEHGYYFHGQTLYNPVLKVPLIIRVPGWFSRQVDGPVSLIDVAPTLLELFGITIPNAFEGRSLVEAMLGRAGVPERPVFAELLPYTHLKEKHQAIIDGDDKFIHIVTSGVEEYYDLAEDPGEQNNLIDERPERAAELRERLDRFMQGN